MRNCHVVALNEVFVLLLPDELAAGKEHGAKLPVLEFLAQFVVADAQAHAVRLGHQRLLIDELLGRLIGKIGQQHAGLRSAARKLLPDHGPGFTLHLGDGHLLVANGGQNACWRRANAETGADPARNERDRHRGTDEDEQCAENDLHGRPCILKLSNHSRITPLD